MYKVGDRVWWVSIAQGLKFERAGYVTAIVPAGRNPQDYAPPGTYCKNYGAPRTHASYLIRVPDVYYLFWPQVAALNSMADEKEYIFLSQPKARKHFKVKAVSRQDRNKIKELARSFGDHVLETTEMLEIKAWKTRFWFAVLDGVEYIKCVDRWT